MALVYASGTDLFTWSGLNPSNAPQLLRSASRLVTEAVKTAFYVTDTTGMPTDTVVAQAFNDATCAQATLWAVNNIDPASGGIATAAPVRSKKILSAAFEYDTSASSSVTAYTAKAAAARTLCEESYQILQQAGIRMNTPWVVG